MEPGSGGVDAVNDGRILLSRHAVDDSGDHRFFEALQLKYNGEQRGAIDRLGEIDAGIAAAGLSAPAGPIKTDRAAPNPAHAGSAAMAKGEATVAAATQPRRPGHCSGGQPARIEAQSCGQ